MKKEQKPDITENEKLERVAKLFDEIQSIFPSINMSLDIHGINNITDIDDSVWDIEANYSKDRKETYLIAHRVNPPNENFDITLYGK